MEYLQKGRRIKLVVSLIVVDLPVKRHSYAIRVLSTTEPTWLIVLSTVISLRLCKVPLQCIHDSIALISTFLIMIIIIVIC